MNTFRNCSGTGGSGLIGTEMHHHYEPDDVSVVEDEVVVLEDDVVAVEDENVISDDDVVVVEDEGIVFRDEGILVDDDIVEICKKVSEDCKGNKDASTSKVIPAPPPRFITPPELKIGDKVYGLERSLKDPWKEARIERIERHFGKSVVKLKFIPGERIRNRRKVIEERVVQCKHIAYYHPVDHIIPVGFRVIARTDEKSNEKDTNIFFYAGIVAEPPKSVNKNRYLIFFDDGFAAYCYPSDVRLTWYNSAGSCTWAEVHPDSQKFIKQYVGNYPHSNLAKLRESQIITVEWNGFWWTARVKQIDCSLVTLELTANRILVHVWRGSLRILALNKLSKLCGGDSSTARLTHQEYEGKVVKHQIPLKYLKRPVKFSPHECTSHCVSLFTGQEKELQTLNPLLVPFYHGWARGIEPNDPQRRIYYQAPCGLKMWSLEEIQTFITKFKCSYSIDCFCYDFQLNCFDEFEFSQEPKYYQYDISSNMERIPISQINTVDGLTPDKVVYTNERLVGKGVKVNVDPNFLVCCDCEDDCQDKLKCSCFRLTFEREPECLTVPAPFFKGYQHRRLGEKYMLGIYECNSRCKCTQNCINRVVQHGLKWRLQVFKTASKGYAIRTLQDIPQGAFICVYTGELLSSRQANESGSLYGDEYLANIDFIEAAETHKEGYEAFAVEPEPEPARRSAGRTKVSGKKLKYDAGKKGKKGDEKQKQSKSNVSSQNGTSKRKRIIEEIISSDDEDSGSGTSKTRTLFGPEEDAEIFAIDAKKIGNIGRYLNHSCDPNVFAQDVFLDTHDIRFPWVAFFASRHIKCGTELTWDYNYEVGMAEGKFMACNCGSMYCRKRLL